MRIRGLDTRDTVAVSGDAHRGGTDGLRLGITPGNCVRCCADCRYHSCDQDERPAFLAALVRRSLRSFIPADTSAAKGCSGRADVLAALHPKNLSTAGTNCRHLGTRTHDLRREIKSRPVHVAHQVLQESVVRRRIETIECAIGANECRNPNPLNLPSRRVLSSHPLLNSPVLLGLYGR